MSKRFRIAFSFAGEKREYVAQVAALLAEKFDADKILYDEYHEAEFARHDLGIYLPMLYGEESDLIIPILCPNYDKKRWTGWEWLHIYGLLTKADGKRVMPCRFEYTNADGLSPASGYIELDHKTPEQTATLILERLALNEGFPRDHYTKHNKKPNTFIPNNLPRLQYFFGREADLKKITDALAPDARGWGALIDGPGGIGKTSLAIRAAELVPSGRFRRIIFLSAKERELTADGQRALGTFVLPGYLEMLNAIARELNQSVLTKSAENERAEVILRALREADVLLLLDNLETLPEGDRDQLFAFLSRLPRGCSAIATSRRRTAASAVVISLDRLDWLAARDLMVEIAKNNSRLRRISNTKRRSLYEETGGNPLLLCWVTGQLGLKRCRTIDAALNFLRSTPADINPLEFIFGDLLNTFSENETKVLAALTHFTTTMEVKFIAKIAHLHVTAVQGSLNDLANRSLVVSDTEERRFVLMPMVADFFRRSRTEVIAETGKRLEQYAYTLIIENGYRKHNQFSILDATWSTVSPALPLFLAGSNLQLQTVCDALRFFLDFTGRWDEWLFLSQQAEVIAEANRDNIHAGWRAYEAGWVHYLRSQTDPLFACINTYAKR